jgi:hypothetical protein
MTKTINQLIASDVYYTKVYYIQQTVQSSYCKEKIPSSL